MRVRFAFTLLFALVGALLGAAHPCAAQKQAVSSRKQAAFLRGAFRSIHTVADLPAAVKSAFPSREMKRDFRMADPSKPFQVTDVISDRTLPRRRLILAGIGGADKTGRRHCFLFFERGRRGLSSQLLIFELTSKSNTARPIWHGYGGPQTERASVDAIRNALARGDFSEMALSMNNGA